MELAVSVILLFTMIFGIMDCSRAVYVYHFVSNAAQEATRYASVRGATWSSSCATAISYGCTASSGNISSFVQSLATAGIDTSKITTTSTWPGKSATGASCTSSGTPNSSGCLVVVTVAYSFSFILPFLPRRALALSSTSELTIAN